ncbi:hypothetical protein D3C80_1917860 [compost metagenome]
MQRNIALFRLFSGLGNATIRHEVVEHWLFACHGAIDVEAVDVIAGENEILFRAGSKGRHVIFARMVDIIMC